MGNPDFAFRVGVCSCAAQLRGLLANQEFRIERFGDVLLRNPRRALVKEVFIPGLTPTEREKHLARARCHAFIDFHNWVLEVSLRDYSPQDPHVNPFLSLRLFYRETRVHIPMGSNPTAELALRLIAERISDMNRSQFCRWRHYSSLPPNRQMPQIITPQEVVPA